MSDIKGKALSFGGINTRDLAPQVDAVTATGGDQTITVTFRGVEPEYLPLVKKYRAVALAGEMPDTPNAAIRGEVAPNPDNGGSDEYTELLYHFDDSLQDQSGNGHTATSNGITYIDGKFGKAANFNGSAKATIPSPGISIGTGDFTVDFWIFLPSYSNDKIIFGGGANGNFMVGFGSNVFGVGRAELAWDNTIASSNIPLNTWTHIEISRDSGMLRIFVGGVLKGTFTNTNNMAFTGDLGIGMDFQGLGFVGGIDEFRLSVGIARHTADFTPPDEPYGYVRTHTIVLTGCTNNVQHGVRVYIECTNGWQTSPISQTWCTPMAGIALGDAPLGTLVNLPRTDNANAFKLISVNHYEVNASYPQNACILIHNTSEQKSGGYFATSSKLDISSWVTYLNGTWLSGFEDGIQSKLIEVGASNTGKVFLPSREEAGGTSSGNFTYFVDNASRISANSVGWQTRTLYTYKDSDGHTYYACYGVKETGVVEGWGSSVLSGMVLWRIRPCVCLSSDLLLNPNPNADGSYDLLPV